MKPIQKLLTTAFLGLLHLTFFCLAASAQNAAGFREKFIGDLGGYIRGMSFLTPSTGFVAFSRDIGFTQDSGQTYMRRPININNTDYNGYSVNLTLGFSVMGVHAISKDSLLVYGDYSAGPAILFSANQGLTWKLVFHQLFAVNPDIGNSIFDLKFLTPGNYIAVNLKEIIQTSDGGQTWNVLYHMDPFFSSSRFTKISAPSPSIFYVAAGDYLFKKAYSSIFGVSVSASPGLDYNNVSFVSEYTGYVTRDDNSAIYKTVDGGNSWTKMNDPATSPVYASDLYFVNDSTGFAADRESYNVLKTTDHGVTWEYCKRDNNYQVYVNGINRLFFLNDQTLWAGGQGEYLMFSTSGGSPTMPKAVFKIDTTNLTATSTVELVSLSKNYYQHKWYKNDVLISNTVSASYIHDIAVTEDTIKLIVINGTDSDTTIRYQHFVYTLPPVISSFTPSGVGAGGIVTITGIGFINTSSVTFGGSKPVSFTVHSNASITAIVGGGLSGDIIVTTPNGLDTASGFNYLLPAKPLVMTFSPASGSIGTKVTITGNNFNTVVEQNIVHFGKVKATVLSATVNQIVCTVPTGASFSPVTIVNLGTGLMGASAKPFAVTFESHNFLETGSFKKAFVITHERILGLYPWHLTIGDIDADGKNDLIVVMRRENMNDSVFIYRNKSTPNNFVFDQKLWVANGSYSAIADINNDGLLDLMVGNAAGNISVLINAGSPGDRLSFKPPVNINGLNGVSNLCVGDINGDGRVDLVMAGFDDQALGILQNTSFGDDVSFANLLKVFPGGAPRSVTLADLDGDGENEIVAAVNGNGWDIFPFTAIYKNITSGGTLSFAPVITLPTFTPIVKLFVADLNNDNKEDIINANEPQFPGPPYKGFSIYSNSSTLGSISFLPRQDIVNNGISDITLTGEIDNITGDSLVDYIAGIYGGNYFSVHKNTSVTENVNFDIPIVFGTASIFETTICSADLDGDGRPEINSTQKSGIEIFKNKIEDPIEIKLCPPASAMAVLSNVRGSTYQWQQDTGTGFVNLADDALINGSNTEQLTISYVPTSYYGYQYRCVVSGKFSSASVIKFSNTFTRNYNYDWNYVGNWSCFTLPDKNTDVIIGTAGVVEINSNVEVKSLTINPFAILTVNPGFTLKIN